MLWWGNFMFWGESFQRERCNERWSSSWCFNYIKWNFEMFKCSLGEEIYSIKALTAWTKASWWFIDCISTIQNDIFRQIWNTNKSCSTISYTIILPLWLRHGFKVLTTSLINQWVTDMSTNYRNKLQWNMQACIGTNAIKILICSTIAPEYFTTLSCF